MNYESLRSLIREALLLELRNVGGEGPPSSSKYFARPIGDGFVIYYDVGSGGRPQAVPGTIGQYYDFYGAKSVSGKDYKLSPDQLTKAKELVDLGVYKTTEEPNKYPDIEFSSSRKGSPGSAGLLWKSEKDVPPTSNSYYPKSPQFDFLLVDTDQKMVSLDASWTGNQSRRGGSTPTKDSSKSYVIPSGDVAFESDTLTLQKLFKHLIAVDPRVTADYKIVSPDDKFTGKTIGGAAEEPRTTDIAVGGTTGKLVVYHGTSTKRWPEIEKKGMLPGKYEVAYQDLIAGYSEKNLYFTMDPHTAENYATRAAIWDKAAALILKVEIPDITRIVPDEDSMGWFDLKREYTLKRTPGEKRDYSGKYDLETGDHPKVSFDREDELIQRNQHVKNIFGFLKAANQSKAYGKREYEAPDAGSEWVKNDEYYALLKDIEQNMAGFLTKSLGGETFAYKGWIPPKFVKKWKEYPRAAYPSTVNTGGGTGTEYEDTRQKVLKKVKRFGESRLRDLVRGYLAEETLGIHGALMDDAALMKSLGHGGIKINPDGPVTDEEADAIAKKLKSVERVYAYSRGAAALSKATQDDDFEGLPPVTYVAPAALRKWTDAPVPRAPGGSVTIIGDKDSAVPVKQACQVAKNAGTPLYVYPGKSHKSILYTKGEVGGDAYEVNVDSCVSDPEMPDWGREATGTEEEVAKQIEKIKTHSKNESLIRSLVRAGMKR